MFSKSLNKTKLNKIKKQKKVKRKNVLKISKSEKKEIFNSFNLIKGIVPKYNVIINEFNDHIIMFRCKNFLSLKYIISNMEMFGFKEIEIFVYEKKYYITAKFNSEYLNEKNKDKSFKNVILELKIRKDEFEVLDLYEIFDLVRKKVYRNDIFRKIDYKKLYNYKNYKELLQNKILAKNVSIKKEYICFNFDEKKVNEQIKHQIIGLQMYPSVLYDGFLSEINHLDDIETTTYIKTINLERVKQNINSKRNEIISNYIVDLDRLYNTCFYIHIWGTENEIENKKKTVIEIANKYHVILNEYFMQQKRAFCAFLPLMNNNIKSYRAIPKIDGILPFNEDIIKNFNSKMKYGIELLSKKELYFNRNSSGIILSSNRESKRRFIQNERNHIVVDLKLKYFVIDFDEISENVNDYKTIYNNTNINLSNFDRYNILKMYCMLCLGAYRENNTIEKNEKEDIFDTFDKIANKLKIYESNTEYDYMKIKELLFLAIEKNKILTKKLNKYIDMPNEKIRNQINTIIKIYRSFYEDNNEKKYIYIYNIQYVINCLDLLCKEIFNRKSNNLYLLSSYNDFLLFNNIDVSNEIFKAPYINILDIKPNDLLHINSYLNLSNKDLIHLRNKSNITGTLYTDICEFNYFIKKDIEEDGTI